MKQIIPLLLIVTLVACGKTEKTETAPASGAVDTVDALAANPERLKEVRELCKADRAKVGEELCRRAAEATNKRFFGDGKTPYNPPKEAPKF